MHEGRFRYQPTADEAGLRVAHIARVHALVAEIAGSAANPEDPALDRGARVSAAYAVALPVVRKRFDALADEVSRWATAGVHALLAGDGPPPRPAAARLAGELARARRDMERMLAS